MPGTPQGTPKSMPRVPLTVEVSGPGSGPMDRCIEFSTVGQLTGELAFLTGEPRAHTLTALCQSELWVLTAEVRAFGHVV